MKYVSFKVEEEGSFYCINLENVICFIDKSQINIRNDKLNDNFIGITSFRNNVYKVLNTLKIFNSSKEYDYTKYIFMNLSDYPIIIPVFNIVGIFDSDDISEVNSNSSQFNFVIKNKEDLNVLVEEYFFKLVN
jgi:hypothetical protein